MDTFVPSLIKKDQLTIKLNKMDNSIKEVWKIVGLWVLVFVLAILFGNSRSYAQSILVNGEEEEVITIGIINSSIVDTYHLVYVADSLYYLMYNEDGSDTDTYLLPEDNWEGESKEYKCYQDYDLVGYLYEYELSGVFYFQSYE